MIDVTIIVVSWNTRDVLRNCLNSISHETTDMTYEIIVVDNSSRDGTQEMVRREFPSIKLIANDDNRGFAMANNQGIRLARSRFVLLLNPDTVVHPGALDRVYAFAQRVPQAAVVGCRTLNANGSLQRNCFLPPSFLNLVLTSIGFHRLFSRSKFFGRERMTYWDLDDAREVAVVAGCFMLVRRAAIDEVGLLDERFFMYAEEVDWCVRFRAAGWQVWYTPSGTITHLGGVSAALAFAQMKAEKRRSLFIFLRKYHSASYVLACRAVLMVGLLVRSSVQTLRNVLRFRPSPVDAMQ
jgi:GT2 family glycosyltransferase